jgi:hypothetical protein
VFVRTEISRVAWDYRPVRTGDELVAHEAELHAEARAFLDEHDVEAQLARAGRVLLVGSFVTGLMVWRDLDVCVAADGLDRAGAWTLVEPLVLAAARVRYEHLEEPDDRRHYFVLRLRGWKLDLSLFTAGIPPEVEAFQDDLLARLDDETRLTILRLKELWHRRPEYPELVGGYEICAAVLGGVGTSGELEEQLRRRGLLTRPGSRTG